MRRSAPAGRLIVRLRVTLLLRPLALILAMPLPACGGDDPPLQIAGGAARVPPVREGLLIARARELVLRLMADGSERMIKPADAELPLRRRRGRRRS